MKLKIFFITILLSISMPLMSAPDRNAYYLNTATYTSYKEFLRGVHYFNQERYDASIESFKNSLNSNPSDKYIRYWYSRALYKGGYNALAINEWRNLTRMGFTDPVIISKLDKYATSEPPLSREEAFSNFIYLKTFSSDANFLNNINQVIEIKVDKDNNIYALDYSDEALKIFDVNGKLLKTIDKGKKIERTAKNFFDRIKMFVLDRLYPYEKLKNPRGFDIDSLGNIYIANTGNDNILKFDSDGKNILTIGSSGVGDTNLLGPTSVSVDKSGKIYVADTGNNRIVVFDENGEYLFKFGNMGEEEGNLFRPSGVLASDNYIYVADTGNSRVEEFDTYGNYISTIYHETFTEPRGLSLTQDGDLFIADFNNVYYYNLQTKNFTIFQNSTRYSAVPTSAVECFDSSIYISDFLSGKIDVYTRKEQYYNNLDVFIDRSYANRHPAMVQKITVRDISGEPVIGLSRENFFVYENDVGINVDIYRDEETDSSRFIYLIEDSLFAKDYEGRLKDEVANFTEALSDDDEVLVIHYNDTFNVRESYDVRKLRVLSNANSFTFTGDVSSYGDALNEAIRLSGTSFKKTHIIHFNISDIIDSDFKNMTYSELGTYAKNNSVSITEVYLGNIKSNYFLDAISKTAYGKQLNADNSINYGDEIALIKNINFGTYYLRYNTHSTFRDKGTYRPIKIQVRYRDIFGEEESGYVVP